MKRIANRFTYPTVLAVATVLLAILVLAGTSPTRAASPVQEGTAKTGGATSKTDRVEARIKDLHTKLRITPEQEVLWNNVAQAMRDNAKTMEALIRARSDKAGTMNAVEDLKSYGEITQGHADTVKTFIPIFEPLYAGMSEAQKKDADVLFHPQSHHAKAKAKGRSK
ncbi:MAG TPA: Spy/CpxP family protein refolding chaperone [Syntrophorhabdaceae bacterium]